MSIKFALLGLIAEQPMHGYRLKEAFDERVSSLWGLTTAQIYQTLGALERSGLLESRGERVGSRPERRTYRATEAGKRQLDRWLDEAPSMALRPFRDDLFLRMLLLRNGDAEEFCRALDRHDHEIRHLSARVTQTPRRHASSRSDRPDVSRLFHDEMVKRFDADLDLIRRCRDEIERWSCTRSAPTSPDLSAPSVSTVEDRRPRRAPVSRVLARDRHSGSPRRPRRAATH